MVSSKESWRWAVGGAGGLMVLTAAAHGLGYGPVTSQLATSGMQPVWQAAVRGLWLVYALHLLIVGCLFLLASIRPRSVSKTVLVITGLVPVGDTVVLFVFVGVFIGTVMLTVASALLYLGVALRR